MGRGVAVVVVIGALAACGGDGGDGGTLTVFAASSLVDAFGDIEAAFEVEHPDIDVVLNVAASSALREQILAGAPADVYASANAANVDELVDAGAVAGEPADFATNRLVIVVPSGNPADVQSLDDFARDELVLGVCAAAVPCGALARAALEAAGVEASVDTEELDVRSLVRKVQTGELDAGIAYRTDTLATEGVVGFTLPPASDVVTSYRMVAVTEGDAAGDFVDFVLGDRGQAILDAHGFGPP